MRNKYDIIWYKLYDQMLLEVSYLIYKILKSLKQIVKPKTGLILYILYIKVCKFLKQILNPNTGLIL